MTSEEYGRAVAIVERVGNQWLLNLQHNLRSALNLSWFDIKAIVEMVMVFYPFKTAEKFRQDVWQFCQRLENS